MSQVPPNPGQSFEGDPPSMDPPPPNPEADDESRRQRATREKEARDNKLENLMLRAGLDPQSADQPINKLFFEGYTGDLTNEAVLEAAKGYGLLKDPTEQPPPTGDITDPDERRQTQDRQTAAGGAAPDGGTPSEDPRKEAVKVGLQVMEDGGTQEGAIGAAFDSIAAAGFGDQATGRKPDPRAQWDPTKDDPRRRDQGW